MNLDGITSAVYVIVLIAAALLLALRFVMVKRRRRPLPEETQEQVEENVYFERYHPRPLPGSEEAKED